MFGRRDRIIRIIISSQEACSREPLTLSHCGDESAIRTSAKVLSYKLSLCVSCSALRVLHVISCVEFASVLVFPHCPPHFQSGLAKSAKGQQMVHCPLDTIISLEYTHYITNPQYSIQSQMFPFSRQIRLREPIQQPIPTNFTTLSTHITTHCATTSHHAEQQC